MPFSEFADSTVVVVVYFFFVIFFVSLCFAFLICFLVHHLSCAQRPGLHKYASVPAVADGGGAGRLLLVLVEFFLLGSMIIYPRAGDANREGSNSRARLLDQQQRMADGSLNPNRTQTTYARGLGYQEVLCLVSTNLIAPACRFAKPRPIGTVHSLVGD